MNDKPIILIAGDRRGGKMQLLEELKRQSDQDKTTVVDLQQALDQVYGRQYQLSIDNYPLPDLKDLEVPMPPMAVISDTHVPGISNWLRETRNQRKRRHRKGKGK